MPISRESLRRRFKNIWAPRNPCPFPFGCWKILASTLSGLSPSLMELAEELDLNLMAVEISPKGIASLRDLASLVTSLVEASSRTAGDRRFDNPPNGA